MICNKWIKNLTKQLKYKPRQSFLFSYFHTILIFFSIKILHKASPFLNSFSSKMANVDIFTDILCPKVTLLTKDSKPKNLASKIHHSNILILAILPDKIQPRRNGEQDILYPCTKWQSMKFSGGAVKIELFEILALFLI